MVLMKSIKPPLEERDLDYKLARNFSELTRVATASRGINNFEEFLMVINECQNWGRDIRRMQETVENSYPKMP